MFDLIGTTQFENENSVSGHLCPLTPVERRGDFFVKRDDLWDENDIAWGGKARTAGLVARRIKAEGGRGMALALARNSSVPGMVSRVCYHEGIGLTVHIPKAKSQLAMVFQEAEAHGAQVFEHQYGYMTVLRSALRKRLEKEDAGYCEIGIGLEYEGSGAEDATAAQAANIPEEVKRVVCPVGSGGMLKGIIRGRKQHKKNYEVLGVCVARQPKMEIPPWVEFVKAIEPFDRDVEADLNGLLLDPTYEAKCCCFLQPGDLLWVVGHRDTE